MDLEGVDIVERNVENGQPEVIDFEYEDFFKQGKLLPPPIKTFQAREELLKYVQCYSLLQGYITTIKDSKKDQYVTLGCDRGGSYRNRTKTPIEERKRKSSSRLINCPFRIKGVKLVDGSWVLRVATGAHNHEASNDMSRSPSFCPYSKEEVVKIKEMSKSGIPPRQILASVRPAQPKVKEELVDGEMMKKKYEIPTISIAVPGSITHNAQSLELATRLAGQIARAATIFRVDEIVVYDNKNSTTDAFSFTTAGRTDDDEIDASILVRVLEYLETPQYLRRRLFPMYCVGPLPPLDAPHHLQKHEWCPYREGITLIEKSPDSTATLVDVGLYKNVFIDETLEPGIRVTVAMGYNADPEIEHSHKVVPSSMPKEDLGLYWGFKVRYASNMSSVFKECPYKGGYDHTIGTSERGLVIKPSELTIPRFRHLLIAFGGPAGLEQSIIEASSLEEKDVHEVFDFYLNTCPHQGSRTIQTEEAVFISLQYFQEPISNAIQQS
ncbi:Spout domain containing methyltransferase [Thalictrum thalictroides]|uniref:Spout domain containing methyltransferase n=1 Tax=Thalictrum thalictroides TaxID=46969 RepID=A0A7J6WL40_THATH|nr:Spout domain containing methyltransferase [Thalictrum thalictroides]